MHLSLRCNQHLFHYLSGNNVETPSTNRSILQCCDLQATHICLRPRAGARDYERRIELQVATNFSKYQSILPAFFPMDLIL